jgi:predicted Fe-Mo cluster-binding NifX family protein
MKIAVSTDSGQVSAHFGRCPEYTIFVVEDNKVIRQEVIPNPGHEPGFLPRYLAEKGVNCIIAGGMGPRAQQLFEQNKIKTVTGAFGDVASVVEKYLQGSLELGEDTCEHH